MDLAPFVGCRVNDFFESRNLGEDAITARALGRSIKTVDTIDRLIASYDLRRDRALKELEQRRELLARRAKEFAENVQNADFVEHPINPTSTK